MASVVLGFALLVLGCNEAVELSGDGDRASEVARASQDQEGVVAPQLSSEVGPIEVPFTLNEKNAPVTTVVAEGEVRVLTMQLETAEAVEIYEEKVHDEQFEQKWLKSSQISETFAIANQGIVDIVLIIDDSDSMQSVHKKLKGLVSGNNLKLLKGIENSNWKLAIADTQAKNACVLAVITKNNIADYLKTIEKIENVQELDHHERVVPQLRWAVGGSCPQSGADWMRPKSTLAVIVATDEDHQCQWANSPGNTGDGNTYDCAMAGVSKNVQKVLTSGKVDTLKLYGIMDETNTCGMMRSNSQLGHCYAKQADMSKCKFTNPCARGDIASGSIRTGDDDFKFRSANFAALGFNIKDIHRSDYAGVFNDIITDLKPTLQNRFLLKRAAEKSTLTIKINGTDIATADYTLVDDKVLEMKGQALTDLEGGATMTVAYRIKDSVPFKDTFSIDSKADMSTVVVSINGTEKVKDTDYRISGNDIALIGSSQADKEKIFPEDATAVVSYRHLRKHYPTFILKQPDIVAGSIKVYVDDVATMNFTLGTVTQQRLDSDGNTADVEMTTVSFKQNHWPQHEQVVKITYSYYTPTKILSYDDNVPAKYSVTAASCKESEDTSVTVSCRHENGMIVFDAADFERDLEVIINLTVAGLQEGEVLVPDNLVASSLLLTMDGEDACDQSTMVIESGVINLTSDKAKQRCPFLANWDPDSGDDIKLSYQTYTPNQEVEVINSAILSHTGSFSSERWEVYLGGTKKKKDEDYTISGRKITFTGQIAPDQKGKVDVYLVP